VARGGRAPETNRTSGTIVDLAGTLREMLLSGRAGERILNPGDPAGEVQCPGEFGCGRDEVAPGCGLIVEEGHPDRDGPQRLPGYGQRYGGPFVLGEPGAEPGFVGADESGELRGVARDVGDVDAGVVG
jgi:hypothetical protein